jgi:hypothetical protein
MLQVRTNLHWNRFASSSPLIQMQRTCLRLQCPQILTPHLAPHALSRASLFRFRLSRVLHSPTLRRRPLPPLHLLIYHYYLIDRFDLFSRCRTPRASADGCGQGSSRFRRDRMSSIAGCPFAVTAAPFEPLRRMQSLPRKVESPRSLTLPLHLSLATPEASELRL